MAIVRLARGRERRLESGHPWVYRTEIDTVEGTYEVGDIVDVTDYRRRFVGRGYINPASMITVRLMTWDADELIDRDFFERRLQSALSYRRSVLQGALTDSYRLVFAEADFLPGLIVDKFGPYLVVQTLTLGIDQYKSWIVEILAELVRPEGIFERNDASVRELEGLDLRTGVLRGRIDAPVTIHENGMEFVVDITGGQKTGYFLDQRENRAAIRPLVGDSRVLDCFCHTGGFSVHAAQYGAREVTGIDISAEALEFARRNAALNGVDDVCSFREANVFDALREFDDAGEQFDVVILDPPAFVKSKRALKGALRGYKEINLRAMKILRPGGFLVTCSCSYHLPEDIFIDTIQEAARDTHHRVRLIANRGQAPDHPWLLGYDESRYLKCLLLQVL